MTKAPGGASRQPLDSLVSRRHRPAPPVATFWSPPAVGPPSPDEAAFCRAHPRVLLGLEGWEAAGDSLQDPPPSTFRASPVDVYAVWGGGWGQVCGCAPRSDGQADHTYTLTSLPLRVASETTLARHNNRKGDGGCFDVMFENCLLCRGLLSIRCLATLSDVW